METSKKQPSHLYSIVSITLVLFVLGLLGILFINANRLSSQLKKNLEVTVVIKDAFGEKGINNLKRKIQQNSWAKEVSFISKEAAVEDFEKEYGEEFIDILDFNPLFDAFQVKIPANYATQDSLKSIEKGLLRYEEVSEVFYPKNIVEVINDNVQKLSIFLVVLSLIFLFITISLIDSTIRLGMYSKRFLVRSMQLVGATRQFITRPFVRRSIVDGLISGIAASILLLLFLVFIQRNFGLLNWQSYWHQYAYIVFCVILVGVLLSYWSTKSAVLKYLKMKLDDLY